ncbi:MAG: histidine kinase dimerization/phospho-acceptor domain-containing protein [Mangrovibacterium sp.]
MKLLNHSIKYISFTVLVLISIWAVAFYYSMLNEIKENADEELENQKRLIILNVNRNSEINLKTEFDESQYIIRPIEKALALSVKDQYIDTKVYMQDADDAELELESVRMLISVFKHNDSFYELQIINPIVEQDDLIKALSWNIIALYLVIGLSIVVVNGFILKRLWRPFYNFLEELKSYRIGKSKPLNQIETPINEFIDLQKAVNEMNQHSLNSFNQQKEFIENAAHELQTPIAITKNKLELLLEDEKLNDTHAQQIGETYQILHRLSKLNKTLLLLSKIENKQFHAEQEISINVITHQVLEELDEFAKFKNIKLKIAFEEPSFLKIDHSLATILINNLVRNAIFHNHDNGEILIYVRAQKFSIFNTGSETPLHEEVIFNRFHKTNLSSNGTGLGLSIVKAIAQTNKLKITYHFHENKHRFEILF